MSFDKQGHSSSALLALFFFSCMAKTGGDPSVEESAQGAAPGDSQGVTDAAAAPPEAGQRPRCMDQCRQWETRCADANTRQACNDYNGDGCYEWGENITCECMAGSCLAPQPCAKFTVELPMGTPISKLWFWPAVGPAFPEVPTTNLGGRFSAPTGACSVTVEYPGRWESWIAVPRIFPIGAPKGKAILTGVFAGTVEFCELPAGQAAWGATHKGECKPGVPE